MEHKKTRVKLYYQIDKEKLQKRSRRYYRNLFEDEKTKKRYPNTKIKNMSDLDRERKKEYIKNYNCKIKNPLIHLINCVKESESICLNK